MKIVFWAEYNKSSYENAIGNYGEYNLRGYGKNIIRKIVDETALSKILTKLIKNYGREIQF